MPVLMKGNVLFSGNAEFVAVDVLSGEVVRRMSLHKEQYPSHIFGSPAVPFGSSVLFPGVDRLLLLDGEDLRQRRSIAIEGPGLGSPAPYGDRLVTVNERGELLVLDPDTGDIEYSLATGAFQMVGSAPSISGDMVAFGDNMGNIVVADLAEGAAMWEKRIGSAESSAVFQNITIGDSGVYPFTGEVFYALSLEKGDELFRAVPSSCNPLYREGVLYFGGFRSSLVLMNAATGKVLKRYELDSPVTITPAFYENRVLVATRSGTVYMLDIDSI
jgi:outer membrane protein assembly factor BamB